ncbi:MAG: tol-pal system-associated acyl-CoA thioesterase [Rhizobacter sp.]|nr:tol-pal system-associated acyl-CoA thioesterase [Rhizobacter sp.]
MPAPASSVDHTNADFRLAVRVYWEDTDAGGVVFYANYLKFFERARTEWLRSLGHQQQLMRTRDGVMFVVTDTSLRYLRPARLDDELDVTVHVKHAGRAQLTLWQQAWRRRDPGDGASVELLTEGTIRIGCVDAGTFRPARIPTAVCHSLLPCLG